MAFACVSLLTNGNHCTVCNPACSGDYPAWASYTWRDVKTAHGKDKCEFCENNEKTMGMNVSSFHSLYKDQYRTYPMLSKNLTLKGSIHVSLSSHTHTLLRHFRGPLKPSHSEQHISAGPYILPENCRKFSERTEHERVPPLSFWGSHGQVKWCSGISVQLRPPGPLSGIQQEPDYLGNIAQVEG